MIVRWPFAGESTSPGALLKRLNNSTVAWSWMYNALRLASAVILLPLVLHKLPTPELGMYYVLMAQVALVPLVDFGFGPTIGRFVSYAMGGAETIQAQGLPQPGKSHAPNHKLVWQLLSASRILYRYLTLALLVIVGIAGTLAVEHRVNETAFPNLTRLAWAATLISTLFDIYSSYWGLFLQSMNQVLVGVRIGIVAYVLRLVITGVLLVCGAGLLSMPLGALAGTVVGSGQVPAIAAGASGVRKGRGQRDFRHPLAQQLADRHAIVVWLLDCERQHADLQLHVRLARDRPIRPLGPIGKRGPRDGQCVDDRQMAAGRPAYGAA